MKKIIKSFTFWLLVFGVIINLLNLIGQDDKNILLIGINPILNLMSSNASIRDFMYNNNYLWNITSLISFVIYGIIFDSIRKYIKKRKK